MNPQKPDEDELCLRWVPGSGASLRIAEAVEMEMMLFEHNKKRLKNDYFGLTRGYLRYHP